MPSENYYHSEVKEIMLTKPSWILKWGNVIILALLLLVFAFAAFFTYPESLTTPITLTAVRPVEVLKPRPVNWGIQAVLVKEGATVTPGTPLVAWYDAGQADYREVLRLEKLLRDYAARPPLPAGTTPSQGLLRRFFRVDTLKLGTLRGTYRMLNQQLLKQHDIPASHITQGLRQVAAWKAECISLARSTGQARINYSLPQTATPVAATQPILYVQPPAAEYVAHGYITDAQYPTVTAGQKVFVTVAELGGTRIAGRVLGVAPLAENSRHKVFICLLPTERTVLNATFSGTARIVLHNRPLLEKFLSIKS
ncbi:HlyD family efflux transporter periplasmic adaptor subunit [Hymenobacter swuensis]|uniref:Membrane fusion protein biotin-lipoyl like domain-containing protein n=1 Tax=Hymenobacter swuensis DY53 TaxID=1227739 RepID=W8F1U6_9BACT|nr:HlyD family secretion protein [Hymenobacter swuensis]AHJ95800.1 hypothetical protein Hsw_0205 [Hymenobacter swuensis DY53]